MNGGEQVPLYVRLTADTAKRLEHESSASGRSKRRLIEDALEEHLAAADPGLARAQAREASPEVLTVEEAATLLRLTASSVIAAADAGAMPARRVANEWRFSRTALLAWLDRA